MTSKLPSLGLLVPAVAVPVGSVVVIIGALTSNWAISVPGILLMVLGYAVFIRRRRHPVTPADLLFGWATAPRPVPKDIVDRPREDQ